MGRVGIVHVGVSITTLSCGGKFMFAFPDVRVAHTPYANTPQLSQTDRNAATCQHLTLLPPHTPNNNPQHTLHRRPSDSPPLPRSIYMPTLSMARKGGDVHPCRPSPASCRLSCVCAVCVPCCTTVSRMRVPSLRAPRIARLCPPSSASRGAPASAPCPGPILGEARGLGLEPRETLIGQQRQRLAQRHG